MSKVVPNPKFYIGGWSGVTSYIHGVLSELMDGRECTVGEGRLARAEKMFDEALDYRLNDKTRYFIKNGIESVLKSDVGIGNDLDAEIEKLRKLTLTLGQPGLLKKLENDRGSYQLAAEIYKELDRMAVQTAELSVLDDDEDD